LILSPIYVRTIDCFEVTSIDSRFNCVISHVWRQELKF